MSHEPEGDGPRKPPRPSWVAWLAGLGAAALTYAVISVINVGNAAVYGWPTVAAFLTGGFALGVGLFVAVWITEDHCS